MLLWVEKLSIPYRGCCLTENSLLLLEELEAELLLIEDSLIEETETTQTPILGFVFSFFAIPQADAAPPANVSPEMAEAMKQFPQWSQAEIQGYFDQGWDVNSLQDWLDNQ